MGDVQPPVKSPASLDGSTVDSSIVIVDEQSSPRAPPREDWGMVADGPSDMIQSYLSNLPSVPVDDPEPQETSSEVDSEPDMTTSAVARAGDADMHGRMVSSFLACSRWPHGHNKCGGEGEHVDEWAILCFE